MTSTPTDFQQWLSNHIENPSRESAIGTHFIQTFMEDPYIFYLRYVRGLRPIHTAPALIKGGIIHLAIEAACRFASPDPAIVTLNTIFKHRYTEYDDRAVADADWRASSAMLESWLSTWLEHDLTTYHFLHIEDEFALPLSNGFQVTVKPDIIVQRKSDGEIRALDHKTTGRGPADAHRYLEEGDQATAYIWAIQKLYPNNHILGVESDVIFKRSNMREAKCTRVGIVQRSPWYLDSWEISTISWLQTIAQRVAMVEEGYPPEFAFPRGQSYWGLRDWGSLYRSPLPEDGSPPFGYEIDSWQLDRITTLKSTTAPTEAPA